MRWWPFKRAEPKTDPVGAWHARYDEWLDKLQVVVAEFPDHSELEGVSLNERVAALLDGISDAYGEELRGALEHLVLRGEALRKARLPLK